MAAVADNSGEVAVANGNNNLVVETSKSESKEFNAQKLVDMFTKLNPLAKEFFPSSYHYNPTKTGDFNQAPVNKQGNKNFPNRRVFSAFGFVHKITTFEKTVGFQSRIYIY
ncbi:hypothetical protein ERO13_D10G109000v2 [Gossypium hirsutum]|uniref:Polyadenylate-binding protein-interacting protein 9 isoform X2 n=4 Tax=Gossypium TaxID=3633 RepID=A0A1U8K8L3_GOSHI|nr:polyadenylate-binding protein-interacting protein 9 isoform X2 [Gossypium hirsutum]KAB2008737.1 hypothetical protein ES319_D10G118400v1 [Gossypium barbadense]KAG4125648.1 hypothetical protein ERO13_D10G109000v2 [Gossypium hirsutum]TYH49337.1 hypothetical protein ES332_D10G128800v1 [Gossypium tomentosum]TYI60720.1 hypothetical protein E1A91_D10G123000v1 [Gossypium mustelinum]